MSDKKFIQHIKGYVLGIGIFMIIIPTGLFLCTKIYDGKIFTDSAVQVWVQNGLALLLFSWGILFVIWSNTFLFFKGKGGPTEGLGIAVSPKTQKLVTTGPYHYTRNPMVFGMLSVYYSMMIFLNSLAGLGIVICITVLATIYIKMSEEKRLRSDFGDEYVQYIKEVSMIIPIPRKLFKKI